LLQINCSALLACNAIPAGLVSNDRKWTYVEYKIKAEYKYKTHSSAATSMQYPSTGTDFFPPGNMSDNSFKRTVVFSFY
jgi:uncharacterized OsmC-like protein